MDWLEQMPSPMHYLPLSTITSSMQRPQQGDKPTFVMGYRSSSVVGLAVHCTSRLTTIFQTIGG
jgi:hypothetical protein